MTWRAPPGPWPTAYEQNTGEAVGILYPPHSVCFRPPKKLDHGHHVMRINCRNPVGRMYEMVGVTDRFVGFEAQSLNVHVDFPLFQKLALPVTCGKTKIAGIKIHDTRMMRLMEVLLHGGIQFNGLGAGVPVR